MKNFIYLLFIMLPAVAVAQKTKTLDIYSASNGISYKEGDIIKLARGSATDGSFQYVQMGGWAMNMADVNKNNLSRYNNGLNVTIKKIRETTWRGATKVTFIVGGGNLTNYNLLIEDAIATCEIENCKKQEATTSNLDQLKKLKELLDSGALTKEEYEVEKRKLLNP